MAQIGVNVERYQRTTGSVRILGMWAALVGLLRAMRPRQWVKNCLIFVPLVFTVNVHRPDLTALSMIAFAVFCACSSAGYLLNDVSDVESDRLHPVKRLRPIAAGLVPVYLALVLGIMLAVGGVVAAVLLIGPMVGALAIGYLALTAAYTLWLKHIVLLDVFGIAAGFVLRAAAGAAAISVPVSPWLYIATMLGALLIALGKRRGELQLLAAYHQPDTADPGAQLAPSGTSGHRKVLQVYSIEFVDQLILVISGVAIMTYSLYTFASENLPADHSMMLTIPVVLYGLARYLLLVRSGNLCGAPEDLLVSDRPLLASVAVWGVLAVTILYLATLR